ncbi:MAG: flagellar basal body-associated FliL family protein [Gallionellaceae bacterium]|nr:flagellar basal body-associated FliL family protein [Gallionellaceae bacterium]MDD5367202.1 flagellar basal body-associated FliL family protein [Gallionellaceae bacterium]
MAKEETVAVEPEQPKGKGKKKLLIIIALAVVVLLVLAAGAVLLLTPKPGADGKHGAEVAAEDEHPPVYEKLESFTVNLADGETYLQVEIHLQVADASVQEKLKQHMPEVRDAIIRLLSSKNAEELSVLEGKDKLATDVQKQLNDILRAESPAKGVKKVLFNAFIIQ